MCNETHGRLVRTPELLLMGKFIEQLCAGQNIKLVRYKKTKTTRDYGLESSKTCIAARTGSRTDGEILPASKRFIWAAIENLSAWGSSGREQLHPGQQSGVFLNFNNFIVCFCIWLLSNGCREIWRCIPGYHGGNV